MTPRPHGAATRTPVFSGNRRVPGLYERTRADGTIVYDAALRLGGRGRRHRLSGTTKTDAIAELRSLQVDYERGEEHRSSSFALTVAELLDDFTRHMKARAVDPDPRRRRAIRTAEHYDYQLRRHVIPQLGAMPIPDLRPHHVRRVLDEMAEKRLSPSSRTGVLTALSSLMRFAMKQELIDRNPVRDLDTDDRPGAARIREPRYLTRHEITALLSTMGDTFRPVAAVCAYAGLRASESLGLRWRDIDFVASTVAVSGQLSASGKRIPTKSAASAATMPLVPLLAEELRAHRQRAASINLGRLHADALVFTTSRGNPQGSRNLLRAVHQAGDAAGLNAEGRKRVGVHDLRHSFVATALESGMTLPEASALARHANPRITAAAYAGLTDDARAKLAEKLAAAFDV